CQKKGEDGKKGLKHGDTAGDAVTHYLGCLRISERESFLNDLPSPADEKVKQKILNEEERIRDLRKTFEAGGNSTASGKLLCKFQSAQKCWRDENIRDGDLTASQFHHTAENRPSSIQLTEEEEKMFILEDTNANVIYFKKKEDTEHLGPHDHPKFLPSTFPDQKIPLSKLLKNDPKTNPLMWKCDKDMIRYFHIPANNMEWIEEAIARYYGEEKPDLSGPYRKPRKPEEHSKTRMLLRPQFWKGLQHGGRGDLPTHTRHMRPRYYENLEQPKNIALFMPYLHWETDRRRAKVAEVVMRYGKPLYQFPDVVGGQVGRPVTPEIEKTTSDEVHEKPPTTMEPPQDKTLHPELINLKNYDKGKKALGGFLLLAARLYEEMDSYTDEKIIVHHLKGSSPLHPRRTLDQSYYWTLRDTRSRDRDQVVYRGTTTHPKLLYHDCPKKFIEREKNDPPCVQCVENSKKVARVVMVDQLWMWILDENTIITSFPKRVGRNKPDMSAVQKCIRTRLRAARIDEIRSVYDLGIIIIDQCSRGFFHRTQSEDLQPQVMDAFANAIGRVTHKQSMAYNHFWECTRLASRRYASREKPDHGTAKKSQNVLLDINPEGELLREIKDIIEEISIMMQIKKQEENVARAFTKAVKALIQKPEPKPSANSLESEVSSIGSLLKTLLQQQNSALSEDDGWTMMSANELLGDIQNQLQELVHLKEAAENASLGLKDLLDLKQQQASVVEAREAVKQGEETLRQGRAIMLFTVITIIFLPLSFFATLFGMNVSDLTDGATLNYKDVLVFMIPISAVVIFGSLCLAFSRLVRALLFWAFDFLWTKLITATPIYVSWRKSHFNSEKLHESRKIHTNKMKKEAQKRIIDRRETERTEHEQNKGKITNQATSRTGSNATVSVALANANGIRERRGEVDVELGQMPPAQSP
ncbi:hypothetical protein HYFRA_00005226, partial [Hymenoscyphus fraxineus]